MEKLERLIKTYKEIELKDDGTPTGGISFRGETLYDFMMSCDMPLTADEETINKGLKECGIMPIKIETHEPKMVYGVIMDWAFVDEAKVELVDNKVFKTKEKAMELLRETIKKEKETTWIADYNEEDDRYFDVKEEEVYFCAEVIKRNMRTEIYIAEYELVE